MRIQPIQQPTFQYNSPLKTLYRKGELPVIYGFYGDRLTQKNVSLEHLKPHSKGGKTVLSNLVLASKQKNQARGNFEHKQLPVHEEEPVTEPVVEPEATTEEPVTEPTAEETVEE